MDAFLYGPVIAGFWSHADLVRDTFDIDDLLDAHEMLTVQAENRWRAEEHAKMQQATQ